MVPPRKVEMPFQAGDRVFPTEAAMESIPRIVHKVTATSAKNRIVVIKAPGRSERVVKLGMVRFALEGDPLKLPLPIPRKP